MMKDYAGKSGGLPVVQAPKLWRKKLRDKRTIGRKEIEDSFGWMTHLEPTVGLRPTASLGRFKTEHR